MLLFCCFSFFCCSFLQFFFAALFAVLLLEVLLLELFVGTVSWNSFASLRPTISARLGRAVVRVVRSPLEGAAAVGGDPQAQRIELDKALGVGLIIGAAIVVKGGDIGVEQTV